MHVVKIVSLPTGVWLTAILCVLLSWFGFLAPAYALAPETLDSLILGAAPDEPLEVRVGTRGDHRIAEFPLLVRVHGA